jgi:SAM-dependent methyltransferase
LILRSGLTRLHLFMRKAKGKNVDHLYYASLQDRFTAIYKNEVWRNGRSAGSLSGLGSELENTGAIRKRLPPILKSIGTQTLLDVGCGDFTWLKEIMLPMTYIGVDIVRDVIRANVAQFGSEKRTFLVLDATSDPMPSADTALCREVLFHLSFEDIWRVVENIRNCGAKYLIATTNNDIRLNADIISGDFRLLNLQKSPFRLPKAIFSLRDDAVAQDRVLSVWEVSAIPHGPKS